MKKLCKFCYILFNSHTKGKRRKTQKEKHTQSISFSFGKVLILSFFSKEFSSIHFFILIPIFSFFVNLQRNKIHFLCALECVFAFLFNIRHKNFFQQKKKIELRETSWYFSVTISSHFPILYNHNMLQNNNGNNRRKKLCIFYHLFYVVHEPT